MLLVILLSADATQDILEICRGCASYAPATLAAAWLLELLSPSSFGADDDGGEEALRVLTVVRPHDGEVFAAADLPLVVEVAMAPHALIRASEGIIIRLQPECVMAHDTQQ